MAVPAVVAAGTVASGLATVAPGLPAGWAADDIHVLFVETANEPLAAMTGWSDVGTGTVQQAGGVVTALTMRWRRAVAGDVAPTVPDSGDHQIAGILGVRGCATTGDPWDVTSYVTENVADTSVSCPSITTGGADRLVIGAVTTGQDTATGQVSGSWANASLATVTTRFNAWTTSGNGGGFSVVTGGLAAAGATGSFTATLAVANFKTLFTGALRPAVSTGPPAEVLMRSPRPVEQAQLVGPYAWTNPSTILGG